MNLTADDIKRQTLNRLCEIGQAAQDKDMQLGTLAAKFFAGEVPTSDAIEQGLVFVRELQENVGATCFELEGLKLKLAKLEEKQS